MFRTVIYLLLLSTVTSSRADEPCCVEVVENGTGWPVPMVQLRTIHGLKWVTDNAGVIAIDQPDLMNREVWFYVESDGYEYPKDGFGYAGLRLTPKPGKTLRIEVNRTAIAKRVGLLTGGGLFAESQKLGREKNWKESGLIGCDSVLTTEHNGKRFWSWGDSNLFWYPLGIFNCSSATTDLTPPNWLEPPLRPQFTYFRDGKTGRPRGVVNVPGEGLAWLTGLTSLPDKAGKARLVATYMRVRAPQDVYMYGLCTWNEQNQNFEQVKVLWVKSEVSPGPPLLPKGHPFRYTDPSGKTMLVFGDPFPTLQCEPTFEAWQDPQQWTALKPQESVRTASGPIKPHAGSVAFNKFRKRWVTVFVQHFGKPSFLGEVWYAEADSPEGPWGPAVRILSHNNYSFYNPKLHAEFTPDGSPALLFEGTYTTLFTSPKQEPTPRYDYNQVLYRLDLDDERLRPAQSSK